jgi:hypothetical protein
MFDIVIPIGPDDLDQINHQIEYTKKNIIGYRNIYIISCDPDLQLQNPQENIHIVQESIFPFSKTDVSKIHGENTRNGWYLQQLLKLYAGSVIFGILERYLVIDCDTFFLRPVSFLHHSAIKNPTITTLYGTGTEYHHPYFHHMQRLHPFLRKHQEQYSGICHHMMFETPYLRELFGFVESYHENKQFWQVFLNEVEHSLRGQHGPCYSSGASEYEIYFNFIQSFYKDKIKIRELQWKNANKINQNDEYEYDYVSCHHYMR